MAKQERFAANRIYGAMLRKMQPFRPRDDGGEEAGDENGHHAVPVKDYPWKFFPPFVRGPSYVISGDVIPRLLGWITDTRFSDDICSIYLLIRSFVPCVLKSYEVRVRV